MLIIGLVVGVPKILNYETMENSEALAIENNDEIRVSSIEYNLNVDKNYMVSIYTNEEGMIGVAYLKVSDGKYACEISNYNDYDMLFNDDMQFSKMHISGVSSKLVYAWKDSEENLPDGYNVVPISHDGKTIYFCYKLNQPKRYFSNLYILDSNE